MCLHLFIRGSRAHESELFSWKHDMREMYKSACMRQPAHNDCVTRVCHTFSLIPSAKQVPYVPSHVCSISSAAASPLTFMSSKIQLSRHLYLGQHTTATADPMIPTRATDTELRHGYAGDDTRSRTHMRIKHMVRTASNHTSGHSNHTYTHTRTQAGDAPSLDAIYPPASPSSLVSDLVFYSSSHSTDSNTNIRWVSCRDARSWRR